MGPERKDKLASPDETQRKKQEHEQLLLASKRLVEEMQGLLERAMKLAEDQTKLVRLIRNGKE